MSHNGKLALLAVLVAVALLSIFSFFEYYKVETVLVMSPGRYDETQVKNMALHGFAAQNTVLATRFLSREDVEDIPFVDSILLTQINPNTLGITVIETKPVGCFSYLDSYIYFDRNGVFLEGQRTREEKVPFYSTLTVNQVMRHQRLDFKGRSKILKVAVSLSSFFQKSELQPDDIRFDENYHIYVDFGDIEVYLGEDTLLEDKMARVVAVLPKIQGRTGILHAEAVTDTNKTLTFEIVTTPDEYTGGFEEDGEYTGTGSYDENGVFVGPPPEDNQEEAEKAKPEEEEESKEEDEEEEFESEEEEEEESTPTPTPTPAPTKEPEDEESEWTVDEEEEEYGQEDEEYSDEDEEYEVYEEEDYADDYEEYYYDDDGYYYEEEDWEEW